jgi:hypothetical protein
MRRVDELLEDEQLVDTVYEAQGDAIRRAAAVAECKRLRKFAAQLTGGRPILARSCLKAGSP